MGYHIVMRTAKIPAIAKDGGTGSWRDAKKTLRKWYLDQAADLRNVSEKSYFAETNESAVEGGATNQEQVAV